jgi:hypothetical protein
MKPGKAIALFPFNIRPNAQGIRRNEASYGGTRRDCHGAQLLFCAGLLGRGPTVLFTRKASLARRTGYSTSLYTMDRDDLPDLFWGMC